MKHLTALVAAVFVVTAAGIPRSAAQTVNVMNLFGGLMRAAIVEQAKAQWRKINTPELACIEEQLQRRGLSSYSLAERGVFRMTAQLPAFEGCVSGRQYP